jgi:hypothetical protein
MCNFKGKRNDCSERGFLAKEGKGGIKLKTRQKSNKGWEAKNRKKGTAGR